MNDDLRDDLPIKTADPQAAPTLQRLTHEKPTLLQELSVPAFHFLANNPRLQTKRASRQRALAQLVATSGNRSGMKWLGERKTKVKDQQTAVGDRGGQQALEIAACYDLT